MPPIDRVYAGAAVQTVTNTVFTPTVPGTSGTFTVDDATGWPVSGQFPVKLNRGLSDEEHLLCTRSGTTFTVVQRGYDGTSAQAHSGAITVEIYWDARTANLVVEHTDGVEADPHSTKLLNNTRHDVTARHTFGAAFATPGTPASNDAGQAGSAGAAAGPPRSDHSHPTPVATATTITGSNSAGSGVNLARANHDHAIGADTIGASQLQANSVGSSELQDGSIDSLALFGGTPNLEPIIVQSTDPGAVGAGTIWYNTAANKRAILVHNSGNTAWEVWEAMDWIAYTATYPGMFAVGNAVHYHRYIRKGGVVIVNGFFRIGNTTSFSGMTNLAISLPTNAQAKDLDSFAVGGEFFGLGGARCQLVSTAFAGIGVVANAGPAKALDRFHFIVTAGSTSSWGQNVPGTWGGGDEFEWFAEYEPATLEDSNWV